MEFTSASYGLLEDLFLLVCGVGSLCGRRQNGRSPFPDAVESIVAESVVSQSRYTVLTVLDFTMTAAVDATARKVKSSRRFRPINQKGYDQWKPSLPHQVMMPCFLPNCL